MPFDLAINALTITPPVATPHHTNTNPIKPEKAVFVSKSMRVHNFPIFILWIESDGVMLSQL